MEGIEHTGLFLSLQMFLSVVGASVFGTWLSLKLERLGIGGTMSSTAEF